MIIAPAQNAALAKPANIFPTLSVIAPERIITEVGSTNFSLFKGTVALKSSCKICQILWQVLQFCLLESLCRE